MSESPELSQLFFASRYNESELSRTEIQQFRPDYRESLLDGLHLCINPFANYPLDIRLVDNHEIVVHTFNPGSAQYITQAPDGFLIQHSCMSFPSPEVAEKLGMRQASGQQFKQQQLPQFPEGKLVAVPGDVVCFTDHHLAHFSGWTVMVARDRIDDDWGAQAIAGLYYSLAEFHKAPKEDDHLITPAFYRSAELALAAIKGLVRQRVDPRAKRRALAKALANYNSRRLQAKPRRRNRK